MAIGGVGLLGATGVAAECEDEKDLRYETEEIEDDKSDV